MLEYVIFANGQKFTSVNDVPSNCSYTIVVGNVFEVSYGVESALNLGWGLQGGIAKDGTLCFQALYRDVDGK